MRENKKYKDIILEKMQVQLEEVTYKIISNDIIYDESELKLKLTSDSSVEIANDEYFEIKHNRKLLFEPDTMFNISVTVNIRMYYDIEKMNDFKNKDDFKTYIQGPDADLINLINGTNVGSNISLLMSNITNAFTANPLIIPPILENN